MADYVKNRWRSFLDVSDRLGAHTTTRLCRNFSKIHRLFRVINSFCRPAAKGNCRGNKGDSEFMLKKTTLAKENLMQSQNPNIRVNVCLWHAVIRKHLTFPVS